MAVFRRRFYYAAQAVIKPARLAFASKQPVATTPLIITSKLPYRRQPTAPVAVNWGHPLANGLTVFCNLGPLVTNLCRNRLAEESARSGMTVTAHENTIALERDSTAASGVDLGSPDFLGSQSALTIVSTLLCNSSSNVLAGLLAGSNLSRTGLGSWNDNKVYSFIENSGTSLASIPRIAAITQYASVFDGSATGNSNRLKLYTNGLPTTATYTGTIPSSTFTGTFTQNLWLGRGYYTSALAGAGTISYAVIYLRSLSDAEILELFTNPYQMLVPTLARRYFIPIGGSQLLDVTVGNETGIGYAATITQPNALGVTEGSETGTGYSAAITQSQSVAVTDGSEVGEGYALGITQPRVLEVTDGTETGTGEALSLLQPRSLAVADGAETGIGYTLDITAGASRTISVEAGTGADAGYALTILQPRSIGLTAGSEAGIGYTLDITAGASRTISVEAGSGADAGYALTILQPNSLAVAQGDETGTGAALTVLQPRNLSVEHGEESGTGYAIQIRQGGAQILDAVAGEEAGIGYTLNVRQQTLTALPRLWVMPVRDQLRLMRLR